MMSGGFLNALVGDYLTVLDSKLAQKFIKETKAAPLPPGSPGLGEVVKQFNSMTEMMKMGEMVKQVSAMSEMMKMFNASSSAKRKLEIPSHSPAKKPKKVRTFPIPSLGSILVI